MIQLRRALPVCLSRTVAVAGLLLLVSVVSATEEIAFFETKVRPLLVKHCYECHSSGNEIKGGLLLDSREGWSVGGDSGPALVPGDPDGSLLIQSIRYNDSNLEMPPKSRLPRGVVTVFEQWVAMGAPDPRSGTVSKKLTGMPVTEGRQFWSYRPLQSPPVPMVEDKSWSDSKIDRFLRSRMEEKGVRPAPQAAPEALLRRLFLDLTGLPPTPEEIRAFLADSSEEAWERQVDHLLASPHFGEKWGRHWLDVARFGESYTLRGLILREAWRYRDYVIDAFNRDLPYDQFVREQLAGDLLPATDSLEERQRRFPATSFLALGNHNLEEQDKRQLDLDIVDEQLDTLGKAFLGQTMGCARCHDHKFDPIPTRDYHAMAGILASTDMLSHANISNWLDLPLPVSAEEEKRYAEQEKVIAALEKDLAGAEKERKAAVAADPNRPTTSMPEVISASGLPGVVVDDEAAAKIGVWTESTHTRSYVGLGYLHDKNEGKGLKTITFVPKLPKAGLYEVRFAWAPGEGRAAAVPVTVSSADGDFLIQVDQSETPPVDGRFLSLGQYRFETNGAGFVIVSNEGTRGYVVADAVQFIPVEELELTVTAPKPEEKVTAASLRKEAAVAEVARIKKEIAALVDKSPARPRYLGVKDADEPSGIPIYARGVVQNPTGDPVPRGFLQVSFPEDRPSPAIPEGQSGRLELANWIASPENPLTARVYANRVWHWMFGRGITRTTDNFGTTGETPSQPELLDWLANRLIETGWSVKSLVREIALSRAYRVSAPADDSEWAQVDPENALFARAVRRRVGAESLRDSILCVSGQLDSTRGGSTIRKGTSNDFAYEQDSHCRSIYLPAFRNSIPEMIHAFNGADPSRTTGTRDLGTVAPQALFLMNNPFLLDQSKASAERLLKESKTGPERLELATLRVLGRLPLESEQHLVSSLLAATPDEKEAWAIVFQGLFASLDFRYLE